MTVTVERFVPKPESGRPKIAEFKGREGVLAVHISREDGSLWFFAMGPRGGERGRVVAPLDRLDDAEAWLERPAEHALRSGVGVLSLVPGFVRVTTRGRGRPWKLALDAAAESELLLLVREWAAAARRTGR